MFAVIYRSYVKKDKEETYKKLWSEIATYFVAERGAIGSALHQAEDGMYLAYSRWPDKQTRDASWPGEDAPSDVLPGSIKLAIEQIRDCIDEKFDEICMDVVEDYLSS